MSQPEESREKTAKVDDILLKPVLKDLDELREAQGTEDAAPTEWRSERDGSDEETDGAD